MRNARVRSGSARWGAAGEAHPGPVVFGGTAVTERFSRRLAKQPVGTLPAIEEDSAVVGEPGGPVAQRCGRLFVLA